jgi:YaiO family outer membrane protein
MSVFNGNRARARSMCFSIVKNRITYFDAWVLIGRTYTWDNKYDSARMAFREVLSREQGYYDAIDAMIDLEYWTDHYEACIKQCNIGLSFHAKDRNYQIKKTKALIALKQFDKATLILNGIITTDTVNKDANDLLNAIRLARIKNKITINYSYACFEKRMIAPWHLAYLQYSRQTSFGTIIGRLNYANRYNTNGLQVEADAYPSLTKSSYLYLNLGYSDKFIFPHFRSGAEIYEKLPSAFEASLGFRYLSFASSDVFIYTASMGKYIGNYWLSARTYITPDKIGTSVSGMLMARRYFADKDNYVGIRFSYGTSPDDRKNLLTSNEILHVKSDAVRLEFNKKLKQVWIINLAAIYENEEYYPAKFRYIITGDITVSMLF